MDDLSLSLCFSLCPSNKETNIKNMEVESQLSELNSKGCQEPVKEKGHAPSSTSDGKLCVVGRGQGRWWGGGMSPARKAEERKEPRFKMMAHSVRAYVMV